MELHHFDILIFYFAYQLVGYLSGQEGFAHARCSFEDDVFLVFQQGNYLLELLYADERLVGVFGKLIDGFADETLAMIQKFDIFFLHDTSDFPNDVSYYSPVLPLF